MIISAAILSLCLIGLALFAFKPGVPRINCSGCGKPMDPFETPFTDTGFLGHAHCWFLKRYPEYANKQEHK